MNLSSIRKKYKIQNEEDNLNFNLIDNLIDNLDNYYEVLDQLTGGGKIKTTRDAKYLNKYKNLIKSSKNSIKYYKNLAEEQIKNQLQTNQYFSNLIYVLKTQRDYLFNEYLSLGKNVKNSKEKIGMLETMINGLEKHMKSSVSLENIVNKIVLKGGGPITYQVFEVEILEQIDGLNSHMTDIDTDKKFIEKKIEELHTRMKNVIDNDEKLFVLKTKIDWIVKELENKETIEIMETQDYGELLEKVKKAIISAKTKGNTSDDIVKYIHALEEYSSYLENFIKSNDIVLNTMDTSKKAVQESKIKLDKELQTKMLVGGDIQKQHGAGNFEDKYNKLFNSKIASLMEKANNLNNLDIAELKTKILLSLGEYKILKKENFGKLVTIIQLLKQLDFVIGEYKKVYGYLGDNKKFIVHNNTDDNSNMVEIWKNIFMKKNTNYYNEQILKLSIIYFNGEEPTMEFALKNLKFTERVLTIKETDYSTNIDLSTVQDMDKFILLINNTLVAFDHLLFFISGFYLSILLLTNDNIDADSDTSKKIKDFEDYFVTKSKILLRSGILTTWEKYNSYYNEPEELLMHGGSENVQVPENGIVANPLPDTKLTIRMHFFTSYVSHLLQPNERLPLTNVNLEYIEKLTFLSGMFDKLYFKINLKLGFENDEITEHTEELDSYTNFYNIIQSLQEQDEDSTHSVVNNKPRLTPFITALVNCKTKLKPFVVNINKLKYLNSANRKGNFNISETIPLLKVYVEINKQVNSGINSYIQVLPMIFFTVEFPPVLYKGSDCKYLLTYNSRNDMVSYIPDANTTMENCSSLNLQADDLKAQNFSSHAAFFESNNANSTKNIIYDPIIGLDKLINNSNDTNKPVNNVMNIMFALGASGTGKTTRYFGREDTDPDEQIGIIPHIINQSLKNNKEPNSTVSLAYFVCYGQKMNTAEMSEPLSADTPEKRKFNELLMFFNISQITKPVESTMHENDNHKYISYCMPNNTEITVSKNNYTTFYSQLMSKKLKKCLFEQVSAFVKDGAKFNDELLNGEGEAKEGEAKEEEGEAKEEESTSNKTFREILADDRDIWHTIEKKSDDQTKELSELFNSLMNEQKKINTVLPTKNNLESSRGHTCVLIRIGTEKNYKYFPLFDMAGSEHTSDVKDFFTQDKNPKKMYSLIKKINSVTQTEKIVDNNDSSKEFPSLKELLDANENIRKYVSNPLIIRGGALNKITVDEFAKKLPQDAGIIIDEDKSKLFLNKIINEGIYINHTIGMIIFAAMCVGESLQTIKSPDSADTFNDFGTGLFKKIKENYVCTIGSDASCKKTPILLENLDYTSILNSSCIWLQIIFSFLYWNRETQDSTTYFLNGDKNQYEESRQKEYVQDMQQFNFYKEVPIRLLKVCKQINTNQLDSLKSQMINIYKTYSSLLVKDSMCIKVDTGKIKIDYTQQTLGTEHSTFKMKQQRKEQDEHHTVTINYTINTEKLSEMLNKFNEFKFILDSLHSCISRSDMMIVHDDALIRLNKCLQEENKNIDDVMQLFETINAAYNYIKVGDIVFDKIYFDKIKQNNKKIITFLYYIKGIIADTYSHYYKELNTINTSRNLLTQQIQKLNTANAAISQPTELLSSGYYLQLRNNNFFLIANDKKTQCGKINDIVNFAKTVPVPNTNLNLQHILNQMYRIQDGRITATKMVLMHLVTGQGIKHFMVKDTIELAKTLYESTDLKLGNAQSGGNIPDIKKHYKKYESNQSYKIVKNNRLPRLPVLQNF